MVTAGKPIASLRWWIGGLLFASTVINYIDRQTLSLLAPYLKIEYQWSNSDYANIAIAFRAAYSIGQTVFGRLMDRIGTRRGLTLTLIWYSLVSMLPFIIAKASTDPVFFFITVWFPIYLVAKGFQGWISASGRSDGIGSRL